MTRPAQRRREMMRDLSVSKTFSGASLLSSKIRLSYLMMPKMTTGMVIIRSLLMVVVLLISARYVQNWTSTGGDSLYVKSAHESHAALPNMVTYEFRSGRV